jgi:hypothetical protein
LKDVRAEWNFDPINCVHRGFAVELDERFWGNNNVYTLQSPPIETQERASETAGVLHLDVTIIKPLDRTRMYLRAIMDNYSRLYLYGLETESEARHLIAIYVGAHCAGDTALRIRRADSE